MDVVKAINRVRFLCIEAKTTGRWTDADALDAVLSALKTAERERDKLIERWGSGCSPIKADDSDDWWARRDENDIRGQWFPTKAEAVRYAAGLDRGDSE